MKTGIREAAGTVADIGAQNPVFFSESDHILEKPEHILIFFEQIPVQPRGNVILTVGIIIAELGIAELISG